MSTQVVAGVEVDTTECEKVHDAQDQADVLTQFYDWLQAEGIVLATYGELRERKVNCRMCGGKKFDPKALTPRERQLLTAGALADKDRPPCPRCEGSGSEWEQYRVDEALRAHHEPPAKLFARFLGIDYEKWQDEKDALLRAVQAEANART